LRKVRDTRAFLFFYVFKVANRPSIFDDPPLLSNLFFLRQHPLLTAFSTSDVKQDNESVRRNFSLFAE
jgi:hypothetical protein